STQVVIRPNHYFPTLRLNIKLVHRLNSAMKRWVHVITGSR
ncbi:13583_t:CDS:1, partial [Gigaspora rosea]